MLLTSVTTYSIIRVQSNNGLTQTKKKRILPERSTVNRPPLRGVGWCTWTTAYLILSEKGKQTK